LDWAGAVAHHGPVDMVRGTEKRKGSEEPVAAPTKTCPECDEQVFAGVRQCPACGHEFPAPDMAEKLHDRAIESAVLSREITPSDWLPVTQVEYLRHQKTGSPPLLRVLYHCGLTRYSAWQCLEHGGYAQTKAERWWRGAAGTEPPQTVSEAMGRLDELPAITEIRVFPDGKYWRVAHAR
jgi:DNA repair protein RadD